MFVISGKRIIFNQFFFFWLEHLRRFKLLQFVWDEEA